MEAQKKGTNNVNCHGFQKNLFKYIDGSLEVRSKSEADAHLASCECCQKLLQQQQDFRRILSAGLEHAASRVSLSPSAKFRLLRDLENPSVPLRWRWEGLWGWRPMFLTGGIIAIAAAALIMATPPASEERHSHQVSEFVHSVNHTSTVSTYVTDCVPVQKFLRKGSATTDTLECETCVVEDVY
jgi:anti-sigma factor RsiW